MKYHKLLVTTLAAAVALVALLAATAYALPEFLPLTNNRGVTGKSNTSVVLENSAGTRIECAEAKGTGGLETDTLGTFHIAFESCASSGVKCSTEGDSAGIVLSEGSFHFVYDTLGTGETLGIAILLLPKETDFSCLGGLLNNKVKGTLMCLILAPLTSTITHQNHCLKGTGAGAQLASHYWNDNGTMVMAQLLSNLNEGGFKETNIQALSSVSSPLAGAWMNE